MSLRKINEAWDPRLQPVSLAIGHADLDTVATSQILDFAAALPADAIVEASWIDVKEGFASTGSATSASKTGGNSETFVMTDGMDVLLDVDTLGEETATFNFAEGYQRVDTLFPVSDLDGLTMNVSTDGGTDELVTFATPCTTSAHVRAQIAAQTTGNTVSQSVAEKAAFIPTNSTDAPWDLRTDGLTAIIDVDDAGADTATWNVARGESTGAAATYNLLDTKTLICTVDGKPSKTVTFTAAATNAATTALEINAQLPGASCVVNGTETDIFSDTYGTDGLINITGGTGLAEIGHGIASNAGTGDCADAQFVTIAELKTFLEGDITGSSGIVVADIGSNRFSITSGTTGVDSELDVQASTMIATIGLTTQIVIGTADQPLVTSDSLGTGSSIAMVDVDSGLTFVAATAGTGDAVDASVVTAAEVVAVFDTDFTNGSVHGASGGDFSITSPLTGTASTLNFGTGTADTVLGLANETITGVDAVNGTATADFGNSGDIDALLDGANITSAVAKVNGPKGVASDGHYGATTLQVKVISNVNVTLLTAGNMTVWALISDQTSKLTE